MNTCLFMPSEQTRIQDIVLLYLLLERLESGDNSPMPKPWDFGLDATKSSHVIYHKSERGNIICKRTSETNNIIGHAAKSPSFLMKACDVECMWDPSVNQMKDGLIFQSQEHLGPAGILNVVTQQAIV